MDLAQEIFSMTGMRATDGGFIRSRCTVETEFSNNNLVQYIEEAVPGWKVVAPPQSVSAPSQFPKMDSAYSRKTALTSLCQFSKWPMSTCKDLISGHCETCGYIVTEAVIKAIQNGDSPVLDVAYSKLAKVLQNTSIKKSIEIMFGPQVRGSQSPMSRLFSMWLPLFNQAENLMKELLVDNSDAKFLKALTAGLPGVPQLLNQIATVCSGATDSSSLLAAPLAAVPLYVMNYIWDGDALDESQLLETCYETALYSLHVVGVVFDSNTQTVYIVDPNGPLIKGGSMEFLSIPISKLPNGVVPSVNYSRSDREATLQKTNVATVEKTARKKRKAGNF